MHESSLDADLLPCGILTLGDDGRIRSTNRVLADYVGRDTSALRGAYVDVLFSSAARLLYHSYVFPQLKLHGRVEEIETNLVHTAGQRIDVRLSAQRCVDATGEVLIHCVIQPMRERRRLEDQLLNMRLAAQYLPGVLFQLVEDRDGRVSMPFAGDALRQYFGVAPQDVHDDARALWQAVHPNDRAALHASRQESAHSASDWHCRFRTTVGDRTRWLEVHAAPQHRSDDTTLWHGYIADITEHYEREQALIEKASAERANRAKSEFLAHMSHELRTPLNSILGFARLLELELRDRLQPESLQKLQSIEGSGRDLLFLINEILDIARIEAGHVRLQIEPVALQPVMEKLVQQFEPDAHAAGIRLHAAAITPLAVYGDAQRLQQVLSNLISNAIKYNRPQGEVTLRIAQHGERVRIDVADQGPGLDDAQIDALFQPFNRLGAERTGIEGTGLGLVITRALVEQMHGRIDIHSRPGQGSCFTVELPRAVATAVARTTLSRPQPQSPLFAATGRRVLCVEDNPVNVLLMKSLFELRPSYELSIATDAASALQMVATLQPQLLLLDMNLPDATGAELLDAIRAQPGCARIPAIAVSANAMPEDVDAALQQGFFEYWTKPLDIDLALQALDLLLQPQAVHQDQ